MMDIEYKLRTVGLSNREVEVAKVVALGKSNKEVASRLFVTEKTIKFHLTNIYKKLKIKSRAQLIVWCAPHLQFVEDPNGTVVPSDQYVPENTEKLPEGGQVT